MSYLKFRLLFLVVVASVLVSGSSKICAQSSPSITLAWNSNQDNTVIGYHLYEGHVSGNYTNMIDAGNTTTQVVSGLTVGATYFYAVAAYDSIGLESPLSTEVSYTVASGAPVVTLTLPAAGASYLESAPITLSAGVTANGNTITAVRFYDGATLLGTGTAAPYNFTWGNAGVGSHSLSAQVVYGTGITVSSPAVTVTVSGLPAPWQTTDIGKVGTNGSASVIGGVCSASGAGNVGGSADNFRFLYQAMSGNGRLDAQITSFQGGGANACAGLMMRESLTSGSRYAFMGILPNGSFDWQRRNNTGGSTSTSTSGTGAMPAVWARLVRTNGAFYGYKSTNGVTWSLVGSRNISMATNIYFGFAVASGYSNVLGTATFTNVIAVP